MKKKKYNVEYGNGIFTYEDEEIFNSEEMEIGTYYIEYNIFPVNPNTVSKQEANENYEIIQAYACAALIKVNQVCNVILNGTHYEYLSNYTVSKDNNGTIIKNNLINQVYLINRKLLYNWKNSISSKEYELETLMLPYLETLDRCYFINPYTKKKEPFYIEKIEFGKSLKQRIRGRFLNENMEN